MLAYFPEPYEDELLYSLLARYHRHMGSSSPKQTLDDLFGSRNVIAGLDLQGHLGRLSAHLPPEWGLTPERLAAEFTLHPYYLAFQPTAVRERVLQTVTDGSLAGLHLLLGLAPAASRVKKLRFCPACVQTMEGRHAEPYWRRTHQLPGALICSEHGSILRESSVPPALGNRHAFVAATRMNCAQGRALAPASLANLETLRAMARACRETMRSSPPARAREDWAAWYRDHLIQAGLSSPSGRMRLESVEKGLRGYFSEALQLLLAEAGASDLGWIPTLTRRRRRAVHPVLHLLLQEFLKHLEADQPFGAGPWPCLNPLNVHHGQLLIEKVSTHRNHGRLVGVFECGCGYAYTRNKVQASDPLSHARPLRFGEGFDRPLRELVEKRAGIRETARRLHADARTVRLRASKLHLDTNWEPARTPFPSNHDPVEHRTAWLVLQHSHPDAGRKELRRLKPGLYAWLYHHDREWLAAQQAASRTSWHPVHHDWRSIDEQWVRRVSDIAEEIRQESPPRKVTLAEISRRTEKPTWLPDHLRHLPDTHACLRRLRDSDASFQARRVAWAARQLTASGQPLVEWRIRRKAGLGKRLAPEVEAALAKALSPTATTS